VFELSLVLTSTHEKHMGLTPLIGILMSAAIGAVTIGRVVLRALLEQLN
jgi:hypothetical protein